MRVIIVDDEELACRRLSGLLSELTDIEICGTFGTALEALDYIEDNLVEVVFLDISMPEIDGMEMANRLLDRNSSVKVVFVTGYEEYAVGAFELEAVDYLLKPVSRERLLKTVERLKGTVKQSAKRLCVTCFGGFSVSTENGEDICWRSPKVEELFAFLICKGNTTRDEIADALWGNLSPDKALRNINSTLYYIRKALQPYGLESCIVTRHRQLIIDAEKVSCDLYEFEVLQKKSRVLDETWEQLDALYTGELFQRKNYEWSFSVARTLEDSFLFALLKTARQWVGQDRQHDAEILYLRAMTMDFCDEAYEWLMAWYCSTGQIQRMERLEKQMSQLSI